RRRRHSRVPRHRTGRAQGQAAPQERLADARRGRDRRPDPGRRAHAAPPVGCAGRLGRRLALRHRLARTDRGRHRAAVSRHRR
ncbi:hypothetical protein LTR94_037879, partial [Friedmanniomyces endolithicus]